MLGDRHGQDLLPAPAARPSSGPGELRPCNGSGDHHRDLHRRSGAPSLAEKNAPGPTTMAKRGRAGVAARGPGGGVV